MYLSVPGSRLTLWTWASQQFPVRDPTAPSFTTRKACGGARCPALLLLLHRSLSRGETLFYQRPWRPPPCVCWDCSYMGNRTLEVLFSLLCSKSCWEPTLRHRGFALTFSRCQTGCPSFLWGCSICIHNPWILVVRIFSVFLFWQWQPSRCSSPDVLWAPSPPYQKSLSLGCGAPCYGWRDNL